TSTRSFRQEVLPVSSNETLCLEHSAPQDLRVILSHDSPHKSGIVESR
ncbi:MAG: hypothetical protein UU08_C0012G0021, partial [Candidatus Uhrbacteria bacterium GW2011_GWE2_40_58]